MSYLQSSLELESSFVELNGAEQEGSPDGGCLSTDCGREDWLARRLDLLSTVEAEELVWLKEPTGYFAVTGLAG